MLQLHPFTSDDIPTLLGWVDSPDLLYQWAADSLTYPLTAEQIESLLAQTLGLEAKLRIYKAVCEPEEEAIGHIELRIDREVRMGRVCRVLIGPAQRRGEGLGTQMLRTLARIGFEEFELQRLDLAVFDFNTRAIACYERAGFRKEMFLHEAYKIGDTCWSAYIMRLLKEEWAAQTDDRHS